MPLLMGRSWQLQELMAEWSKVYAAIDSILGNTMTHLPFGDPRYGQPTATTFTGRRKHASGLAPTWTWVSAPNAWATPFDLTLASSYQGIMPAFDFDGTNDMATTPDVDFFTRNDAAAEKFSFAMWCRPSSVAGTGALFVKWASTDAGGREWMFERSAATARLILRDASLAVQCSRVGSTTLVVNRWYHLAVTYDGSGGATAGNGIIHYLNGVSANGAATNDANYIAMENLAGNPAIGGLGYAAANMFAGRIAGGPCGHVFEQAEWTAEQVANLYLVTRGPLGV